MEEKEKSGMGRLGKNSGVGPVRPQPTGLLCRFWFFSAAQSSSCILAFYFLVCIFLPACSDDQSIQSLQKANNEWIEGRNDQAIASFNKIIDEYPKGPAAEEALFRLGEISHFSLGDSQQALNYFQKVLRLNKKGAFAYDAQKNIAEIIEFTFKDLDQAIIEYQKLITEFKEREDKGDHQYRIASIYYKKQDYEQALVEFEILMEDFQGTQWQEVSRFKAVELLYTLNRCSEVHAYYDEFTKKFPTSRFRDEIDFVIASCLEDEGRLKEAYEKFKSLEGRYIYPAMLEMKLTGLKKRMKKKRIKG